MVLVAGPWWFAAAARRVDAVVAEVFDARDDARLAEQREWIARRLRLRGMVAAEDVLGGPSPREAGE
jgi:hypothetical protein